MIDLKVPFVGSLSHELKNKISNLFFNDLRIENFSIFTSTKLLDSPKSQIPKILAANFVYNSYIPEYLLMTLLGSVPVGEKRGQAAKISWKAIPCQENG